MQYVGVDACKSGWFAVCVDQDDSWKFDIFKDMQSLWDTFRNASLILVDVPIGLPSNTSRGCDLAARELLKPPRASSVFPAPSREAAYASDYREANELNREVLGVGLSRQTWSICRRIREMDSFLAENKASVNNLRESHPEVCFWALAGNHPMRFSKKKKPGQTERQDVLQSIFPQSDGIYEEALSAYRRKELARDDILDAIALAVTVVMGVDQLSSIPVTPEFDQYGLPMEIVFTKKILPDG